MISMSLVIMDTDSYVLANAAVDQCLKKFSFDEVLIFSDDETKWNGMKVYTVPKLTKKGEYDNFFVHELHKHIKTTHFINIQFDGFILNPTEWSSLFLHYDYIGAPWPSHNHGKHNVGNGGFSLRTKRLSEFVSKQKYDFFEKETPEDVHICRNLRPLIESEGMHFAHESIASHFSAESYIYRYPTFGFHNIRFLPLVYKDNLDFLLENLTDRVISGYGNLILPNLKMVSEFHYKKLLQKMETIK